MRHAVARGSVRHFVTACLLGGGVLGAVDACTVFDGLSPDSTTQGIGPGGNPNGADVGQGCQVDFDCKSGRCASGTCAPAPQAACNVDSDCGSGTCKDNKCLPASATNGIKDGDETDVDCGGAVAPKCTPDKACKVAGDCDSAVCTGGKCQKPSPTDKVKNGDETDVDCGGTTTGAPKCATGKACLKHEDCEIDGCDDQKKCATGRSCTQLEGGRTCGDAPGTESCCGSLPVPGMTTKLDKYKVTAGRMRAFIERTNGNVKGWYMGAKATLSAEQVAQIDPYVEYLPTDKQSTNMSADFQLGGTIYLPKRPSESQGCFVGNAAAQANGSHTYWNGTLEGEDRAFDQKFLDQLPLNCVPYPLAAAFCAWDGGRVQTFAENNAAMGPSTYPWGAAPDAAGYATVGGVFQKVGPATQGFSMTPCPTCDDTFMNWRNNYQNPPDNGQARPKPWDYAYWISAPGRFPKDVGPGGHKDIGGLMIELTATTAGVDPSPDGGGQMRIQWSRQGSWEGHQIGYAGYQFSFMTKYGKTSVRCARD